MHTWAGGVLWVSAAVRRDGWREAQLKRGAGHVGARRGPFWQKEEHEEGLQRELGGTDDVAWPGAAGKAGRRWHGVAGRFAATLPDRSLQLSRTATTERRILTSPTTLFPPFSCRIPKAKACYDPLRFSIRTGSFARLDRKSHLQLLQKIQVAGPVHRHSVRHRLVCLDRRQRLQRVLVHQGR